MYLERDEQIKPPSTEEEKEKDPEEEIQWDGSEAEMVPDEDAEEFEEDHTAIKLTYTLRPREWYLGLLTQKLPKRKRALLWVLRVVLVGLAVCAFWAASVSGTAALVVLGVLCLVGFCATGAPYAWLSHLANVRTETDPYTLKIYPEELEVSHSGAVYTLPLDGTCTLERAHGLLLLYRGIRYIEKSPLLILPLRSVEPGMLPDVEAVLCAGTRRREKA